MAEVSQSEVEAALKQIPGVRAARIVLDDAGKPVEVHIVSSTEKAPKQLVRDVQTVSMANFGIDLDHRIVSVVQFPEFEIAPMAAAPRPAIQQVSTTVRGNIATVGVMLTRGDRSATGESSGPNTKESLIRLAAAATIGAVGELLDEGGWVELDQIGILRVGTHDLAVATISYGAPQGTESLSGSAVVSELPVEAAVRAVLDALNRRLWRQS